MSSNLAGKIAKVLYEFNIEKNTAFFSFDANNAVCRLVNGIADALAENDTQFDRHKFIHAVFGKRGKE